MISRSSVEPFAAISSNQNGMSASIGVAAAAAPSVSRVVRYFLMTALRFFVHAGVV
jgi:hypothetical protein